MLNELENPAKRVKREGDSIEDEILREAEKIQREQVIEDAIDLDPSSCDEDGEFDLAEFQRQAIEQQNKMKEMMKNNVQQQKKVEIVEKPKEVPKEEKKQLGPLGKVVQAYTLSSTLKKAMTLETMLKDVVLDGVCLQGYVSSIPVTVWFKTVEKLKVNSFNCTICKSSILWCEHVAALLLAFEGQVVPITDLGKIQDDLISTPKAVIAMTLMNLLRENHGLLSKFQQNMEILAKDLDHTEMSFAGEVVNDLNTSGILPIFTTSDENFIETSGLMTAIFPPVVQPRNQYGNQFGYSATGRTNPYGMGSRNGHFEYEGGCDGPDDCECGCHDNDSDYSDEDRDEDERLCSDCRGQRVWKENNGLVTDPKKIMTILGELNKSAHRMIEIGDQHNALDQFITILSALTRVNDEKFVKKTLDHIVEDLSVMTIRRDVAEEEKNKVLAAIGTTKDEKIIKKLLVCVAIFECPFDSDIIRKIIAGEDTKDTPYSENPDLSSFRIAYLKKKGNLQGAINYAVKVGSTIDLCKIYWDQGQIDESLVLMRDNFGDLVAKHRKSIQARIKTLKIEELTITQKEIMSSMLEILGGAKTKKLAELYICLTPFFFAVDKTKQLEEAIMEKFPDHYLDIISLGLQFRKDEFAQNLAFAYLKKCNGNVAPSNLMEIITILSPKKQEVLAWINQNVTNETTLKSLGHYYPELQIRVFKRQLISACTVRSNGFAVPSVDKAVIADLVVENFKLESKDTFVSPLLPNVKLLYITLSRDIDGRAVAHLIRQASCGQLPYEHLIMETVIPASQKLCGCEWCKKVLWFMFDPHAKDMMIEDTPHRVQIGFGTTMTSNGARVDTQVFGGISMTKTTESTAMMKGKKRTYETKTSFSIKKTYDGRCLEYEKFIGDLMNDLVQRHSDIALERIMQIYGIDSIGNIFVLCVMACKVRDPLQRMMHCIKWFSTCKDFTAKLNPNLARLYSEVIDLLKAMVSRSSDATIEHLKGTIQGDPTKSAQAAETLRSVLTDVETTKKLASFIPELKDHLFVLTLNTSSDVDLDVTFIPQDQSLLGRSIRSIKTDNLQSIMNMINAWLPALRTDVKETTLHLLNLLTQHKGITSFLIKMWGCECDICKIVISLLVRLDPGMIDLTATQFHQVYKTNFFPGLLKVVKKTSERGVVCVTRQSAVPLPTMFRDLIARMIDHYIQVGGGSLEDLRVLDTPYVDLYRFKARILGKDESVFNEIVKMIRIYSEPMSLVLTTEERESIKAELILLATTAIFADLVPNEQEIFDVFHFFPKQQVYRICEKIPTLNIYLFQRNLDTILTMDFETKILYSVPKEILDKYGDYICDHVVLPDDISPWSNRFVNNLISLFQSLWPHRENKAILKAIIHLYTLITSKVLPPEVKPLYFVTAPTCSCATCIKIGNFFQNPRESTLIFQDSIWTIAHLPKEWWDWIGYIASSPKHTLTKRVPIKVQEDALHWKKKTIPDLTRLMLTFEPCIECVQLMSTANPIVGLEYLVSLKKQRSPDFDDRKKEILGNAENMARHEVFQNANLSSFQYLTDINRSISLLKF